LARRRAGGPGGPIATDMPRLLGPQSRTSGHISANAAMTESGKLLPADPGARDSKGESHTRGSPSFSPSHAGRRVGPLASPRRGERRGAVDGSGPSITRLTSVAAPRRPEGRFPLPTQAHGLRVGEGSHFAQGTAKARPSPRIFQRSAATAPRWTPTPPGLCGLGHPVAYSRYHTGAVVIGMDGWTGRAGRT